MRRIRGDRAYLGNEEIAVDVYDHNNLGLVGVEYGTGKLYEVRPDRSTGRLIITREILS